MNLLDFLFPRRHEWKEAKSTFKLLNGYTPSFRNWNGRIYESELVRAAIDARARHISKLSPILRATARPKMCAALERTPNRWQTWSQFLYRVSTILDVRNTCFIVKIRDAAGETVGVYPICPESWELVTVGEESEPWLRFQFANGERAAQALRDVGILTKFQYSSDFFGESNGALKETMQLITIQRQGIEEAAKNASTYRYMAKVSNFTKAEDLARERQRFDTENFREGNGLGQLLLFPNTYNDIKELSQRSYAVDADQMKTIQESVYRYFGVNDKIMKNEATGDQLDAFFNGAIEPFSIQLSDVMTRQLFTEREQGYGNKILFTANRLQYMTTAAKINMAAQLGDRGILMIDEIRELFNYAPLPDGAGQHAPIRGEYYMVDEGKGNDNESGKDQ